MKKQYTLKPGMLLLAAVLFCCSVGAQSTRNDADGDGVKDKKDKCPSTPKGVAVSAEGCPLDADRDGVPDYMDKCPALYRHSRNVWLPR